MFMAVYGWWNGSRVQIQAFTIHFQRICCAFVKWANGSRSERTDVVFDVIFNPAIVMKWKQK